MKKISFITISNFKKTFIFCLIFILIFAVCISGVVVYSQTQSYSYSIVIDAGHGGIDGGSVGYSGTVESELNLKYAKTLENYCKSYGLKTFMTRTNSNGLYSPFATNKKKDDMKKRKQIIEKYKPNFVVSLHMNSYPTQNCRGAQVFYNKENEYSKQLASEIQKQFFTGLPNSRKTAEKGDYYMVNCTSYTSVIVECGFISNKEEEALLTQNEYMEKLCYYILCGIVGYLNL